MKTLLSVTLCGEVQGRLWQGCDGYKEFSVTFAPGDGPFTRQWAGMRDALLHITNDGDFQHCAIYFCTAKITYQHSANSTSPRLRRTSVIYADIGPCKAIADLFAD